MIDISKYSDDELLELHQYILGDIAAARLEIKEHEKFIKMKNSLLESLDLDTKIHTIKSKRSWATKQLEHEVMRNTPAYKKWREDSFIDNKYVYNNLNL